MQRISTMYIGLVKPTVLFALLLVSSFAPMYAQVPGVDAGMPHLERRGHATQLVVDGKPFLMLSGELRNSSSSSLEYMKPAWPQLAARGLNTVVTPLSWELVEPVEGKYDFALMDGLLAQAREQHMRIVFLWLAAWKNGVSSYEPVWIKRDIKRFPRVVQNGRETETLSTFAPALAKADARAFAAVMEHLRAVDRQQHTVLMMQVENEVGVLGASRDHSAAAERAFAGAVPAELMRHLAEHKPLNEEFRTLWEANGMKSAGTWTQVFGDSSRADELFMAWQYGRYVETVAAAGKRAYPIPLYANAWLGGGDSEPGSYPSGGPQPRVLDVWKAAAPSLDLIAPDLYASDFAGWAARYHRPDNAFFLPETNGGAAGAGNIFYAVGEEAAIGFSPFGIDSGLHGEPSYGGDAAAKGNADLARSYQVLASAMPQVLAAQAAGEIHGFILDKTHSSVTYVMHGMTVAVSLDELFGHGPDSGYGLVMQDGPDSFIGIGKGFRVAVSPRDPAAKAAGIASIDEGTFVDGVWVAGRRLNGDESDQGNHWRVDSGAVKIERMVLYRVE